MSCRSTRRLVADPFGGELVPRRRDHRSLGPWAIDMLNATASMAVAFRRLADRGFRPRGTLIYFGVADEEAGGSGAPSTCSTATGTPSAPTSCSPSSAAGRRWVRRAPADHRQRGREGPGLDASARRRHTRATARCRTAATMPSSPPPRSFVGLRAIAPAAPRRPLAGAVGSLDIPADLAQCSTRSAKRGRGDRLTRCRPRPGRPRLHTHDDLAERRPRRAEDEHDPRCRRPRGRHPHHSRRHDRHRPRRYVAEALGELAARLEISVLQHSESTLAPTTSCGTSSAGGSRWRTRAPRSSPG